MHLSRQKSRTVRKLVITQENKWKTYLHDGLPLASGSLCSKLLQLTPNAALSPPGFTLIVLEGPVKAHVIFPSMRCANVVFPTLMTGLLPFSLTCPLGPKVTNCFFALFSIPSNHTTGRRRRCSHLGNI